MVDVSLVRNRIFKVNQLNPRSERFGLIHGQSVLLQVEKGEKSISHRGRRVLARLRCNQRKPLLTSPWQGRNKILPPAKVELEGVLIEAKKYAWVSLQRSEAISFFNLLTILNGVVLRRKMSLLL